MRRSRFIGVLGTLLALAVFSSVGWASQEFVISCEGTQSSGGGTHRYQYTLKNVSAGPVTLTDFFMGTEDPNPGNYTFIPTAGFTPSIIPNDGGTASVTYTTMLKTAHGVVPPASGPPSNRVIWWSGSAVIPVSGTITFAFDHPGESVDEEWFAKASGQWTISQVSSPMAGPITVYTDGWVHAPLPPPTPATSGWGIMALVAMALALGGWMLIRRGRYSSKTV